MALLLVHRKYDGEPVGIWSEDGRSYYEPGFENLEEDGAATVEARGYAMPWSVFAEQQTEAVNFQEWWSTTNTDATLEDALASVRDEYFSHKSARTPTDR